MKMNKLVVLALFTFLATSSWAQDNRSVEGFGGFSILSFGLEGNEAIDLDREQFLGWQAAVAFDVAPKFGLVFDFGGQYKHLELPGVGGDEDDFALHSYQFMAGPRITAQGERVNGFFHFLAGGANAGTTGLSDFDDQTTTGLALGIGGGLDWRFGGGKVGVRLPQIDWIPMRLAGDWRRDTFRIGLGLVFRGEY